MEEKNELNDIILNKSSSTSNNKKIMLAVATLGVVLILVVMLMDSVTSNGTENLPQAILPPEPKANFSQFEQEEPLFEEVEVIEEKTENQDNLNMIAQRLKQESQEEKKTVAPKIKKTVPKKIIKAKKAITKKKTTSKIQTVSSRKYYIQVGSFSRYKPNKKFLKSITDNGFKYKYHKITKNSKTLNKVLVGPFNNEKKARNALRTIRNSIEAGAFLIRL